MSATARNELGTGKAKSKLCLSPLFRVGKSFQLSVQQKKKPGRFIQSCLLKTTNTFASVQDHLHMQSLNQLLKGIRKSDCTALYSFGCALLLRKIKRLNELSISTRSHQLSLTFFACWDICEVKCTLPRHAIGWHKFPKHLEWMTLEIQIMMTKGSVILLNVYAILWCYMIWSENEQGDWNARFVLKYLSKYKLVFRYF